ncbi:MULTISPECIES: hypothetical protein [Mycolicibacter]|uniref:Uncharacterized protein n=2 Tax=Mycolicibacter TaxID=1073531 RepID=A0ABU5XMF7_9MYCO|nr:MULTISPECIES: hypothetical protein [unclassified Mycolicibacter]MEB3023465.1 hypothetical protein [Mycolicibacter sp. MYC098]MEB3033808.1 hypothetical protein [Mycolicibacter sp. MYC340]
MKVRIDFTVDINEEAWAAEYGTADTAETRSDVQQHAKNMITGHFDSIGVLR